MTCSVEVQTERLPVFWKQRRMLFFDAFSFAFPTFLQRIPFSLTEAVVWTVLSYFPVGLAGEPGRSVPICTHSNFSLIWQAMEHRLLRPHKAVLFPLQLFPCF